MNVAGGGIEAGNADTGRRIGTPCDNEYGGSAAVCDADASAGCGASRSIDAGGNTCSDDEEGTVTTAADGTGAGDGRCVGVDCASGVAPVILVKTACLVDATYCFGPVSEFAFAALFTFAESYTVC